LRIIQRPKPLYYSREEYGDYCNPYVNVPEKTKGNAKRQLEGFSCVQSNLNDKTTTERVKTQGRPREMRKNSKAEDQTQKQKHKT
jgi:hypothetical protein